MAVNYSSQPHQSASPPTLPLVVWGATDKGRQREGNEDAIYPHSGSDTFPFQPGPQHLVQRGQLLVVADGVGGAQAGREASHWAIRVVVERYYDMTGPDLGADLRTAVEVANSSLYQYLQSTGTRESGCTMAAVVIHGNTLYVANVGDSRVYLIRDGQIAQLTRDHTLTQQKLDQGLIRPEQAETDPGHNVLTRSLGSRQTVQVDLFPPLQLAPGDVVLLCSDGLTDMLKDNEIARLISGTSPRRIAGRLIAAANKNGGHDNISVVVAQVAGKKPVAAVGPFAGLGQAIRQQKNVFLAGLVAVAIVGCALLSWGAWSVLGDRSKIPAPTLATTAAPTTTVMVGTPPSVQTTEPAPKATSTEYRPTSTPQPTDTPTPFPTATPRPRATAPQLIAPKEGGEYRSPVTFEWQGTLSADQSYRVTAYHVESGHTLRSGLLTVQSWTEDLPGEKYGKWRWRVAVVQNGSEVATSPEWMFWFNPLPGAGGGGGGGGEEPQPTKPPKPED